ncbi:MAG: hypothetical protein ACT4PW_13760 [Acidimicrobiia bacterium]
MVHPIERLRYVARVSGLPAPLLVRESAAALADLGFDPPALVTACRRVLDRHPVSGPLWYLSAWVLTAEDPMEAAERVADEMDDDPTPAALAFALPEDATVCVLGHPDVIGDALVKRGDVGALVVDVGGDGRDLCRRLTRADVVAIDVPLSGLGSAAVAADLVVLEASAIGPDGFVSVAGSRAAAAVAAHAGTPVWAVGGAGRLLPARLWSALGTRLDRLGDPWDLDDEIVPLALVAAIVGPRGAEAPTDALGRTNCPVAAELLKAAPAL